MSYAYVYAPVSGTVTQDSHGGCDAQGGSAIDLGTSWTNVNLYLDNWYFKSIFITEEFDCCTGADPNNFRRLVKVSLYTETGWTNGYRGFVAFGHVRNIPAGVLGGHNLTSWNFGKVCETHLPGTCAPSCGDCGNPASGCCYTGNHLHLEANNGQEIVSLSQSVTAGSTTIYRWITPL